MTSCGTTQTAHDTTTKAAGGSSTTDLSPTTTAPPTASTPPPAPDATFQPGAGDPAVAIVGKTVGQAKKLGFEVHQQSPFGKIGEWTLFSVDHGGEWLIYTAKNIDTSDDGSSYKLDDASNIVGGQTMPALPSGDWYGVEGVTRNGKLTGGVVMQGHGYDREADGSFPVHKAFRINLTTLRLDEVATTGLDVEVTCG